MPTLNDVKQQLTEWEDSHTRVFLSFSEYRQFYLFLGGKIGFNTNCRNFEVIANNGGRYSSPSLAAFKVVSLGPDPNFGDRITIKLRHRRRRSEITLTEVGVEAEQAELTLEEIEALAEAFIASKKPTKGKSYVQ